MPIVAVNIIKIVVTLVLFGFLLYVARSMRGHVVGPPVETSPSPSSRSRRGADVDDPPPAPSHPWLDITEPGGTGRSVEVARRIVIGRGAAADVRIDDDYASESHVAFGVEGDQVWVEDLGSTNGTTMGATRIRGRIHLKPGAEILVGRTKVTVR